MESNVSIYFAFLAGLLSFVSPCVLPLVPSYISYITGLSVEELMSGRDKNSAMRLTITNSLAFIGGFSFVFISFGASATFVGQMLLEYQNVIRVIGGAVMILLAFYVLGFIKIDFLARDMRYSGAIQKRGIISSFVVGTAFAAGWTPCVGPLLGSILLLAGTSETVMGGIKLLSFYSLGIAVPLLLISLGVNKFIVSYKRFNRYMWVVSKASGVLLLIIGILILSNKLTLVTAFLSKYHIGWTFEI